MTTTETIRLCAAPGCTEPVHSRGLCVRHYFRDLRHGDVGHKDKPGPKRREPEALALAKHLLPEASLSSHRKMVPTISVAMKHGSKGRKAIDAGMRAIRLPNGRLRVSLFTEAVLRALGPDAEAMALRAAALSEDAAGKAAGLRGVAEALAKQPEAEDLAERVSALAQQLEKMAAENEKMRAELDAIRRKQSKK